VWYRLIVAAKYLRVAPWDLAEKPYWWVEIAQAAMSAEARYQKYKQKG
jgi:hypothetical protein